MKKTLLAAALTLGFAGVAQAETSVTLYGIIDTGIGYHKQEVEARNNITGETRSFDRTRTGLHEGAASGQSGSRWGLKGVEDLGNGLRAEFQLESGFNITTGGDHMENRVFSRQAWVGVASDAWGSLRFGRQHNIATDFLGGMIDPFAGGLGLANGLNAFRAADTNRMDNAIRYTTPNYSGFQFGIGYSFNQSGTQDWSADERENTDVRAWTTGIRYANGPVGVALSYDQQRSADSFAGEGATAKEWILGASYDFEVVKLHAAFGQARDGIINGRTDIGEVPGGWTRTGGLVNQFDKGFKSNSYLIGLSAPIGAGKVMASWTMVDPRSNPDRATADNWDMEKQSTYALGYQYSLSKRTNVYAYGAYKDNVNFNDDSKATSVAVGLRHQF